MGTDCIPTAPETRKVIDEIAALLGREVCWHYQRRYHFVLDDGDDGWTLAVSAESAGRFRLEACRWTRPVATLWLLPDDDDRLASAVRELAEIGGVQVGV